MESNEVSPVHFVYWSIAVFRCDFHKVLLCFRYYTVFVPAIVIPTLLKITRTEYRDTVLVPTSKNRPIQGNYTHTAAGIQVCSSPCQDLPRYSHSPGVRRSVCCSLSVLPDNLLRRMTWSSSSLWYLKQWRFFQILTHVIIIVYRRLCVSKTRSRATFTYLTVKFGGP